MKNIFLFLFLIAAANAGQAQGPNLPAGYTAMPDHSLLLRADFDGDGSPDLFCAAQKGAEEDARLVAVLKGGKTVAASAPLSMCCGSLSQKGAVIDVHSKGMRGFTYYKFRWEAAAGDFRLIGYATESFGNAANDGSGTSSINLLTGDYEAAFNSYNEKRRKLIALPKVKRRIAVAKRIYLKSFGEDTDNWLAELDAKYLPKEVQ